MKQLASATCRARCAISVRRVEMACAITLAGFEALKVHMTDLQTGRARLADFCCGVASQPVHG